MDLKERKLVINPYAIDAADIALSSIIIHHAQVHSDFLHIETLPSDWLPSNALCP